VVRYNIDAKLPPTLAAKAVGVSKQLFNYWRQRGYVQPDESGLYRLGDALEAERRARRSGYSSRALAA
jgi:hypothetical protein